MITRYEGTCDCFLPHSDDAYVVKYKAYDDPGRTYGEPEKCYPPESEMEILTVNGAEPELADSDMERIEEQCWEDFWTNAHGEFANIT